MKIKRSEAALLIDKVRVMLADRASPETIEDMLMDRYGIPPLKPCTGEAHSNPFIDNCMCCAPRWGWQGEEVKVS
jgi:hypothetical protein